MMRSSRRSRATLHAPRATRTGLSLIEVLVAIIILSVTMTFVGRISAAMTRYNTTNDVVAKRTFAMQQQANIIGAMPFANLTTTALPASKNFTLGDFNYIRRVSLTTTGTPSIGQTTLLTITIVPQTGIASDTLKKDSLTMLRSAPTCGTALGVVNTC
jgi:prepilin-type N-terminal cleavage/methylation domain-containing protein